MQEKNEFGQVLGQFIENWKPCQRPSHAPIQGNYCILEPLEINQYAGKLFEVLNINNRGESWTYLPYGPFNSLNQFKDCLEKIQSDCDTLLYVISDNKTKEIVGMVGYMRMNPTHGVIEIGHVHFSALIKQTTLATETIYLLLKRVFDQYGYRRCEWKCNHLNEPSRKAAKRFGFTFEGIFRQNFVYKNRNRDTAWFSMLDNEWPALKHRFETWLNPSNFSADGQQILKLSDI